MSSSDENPLIERVDELDVLARAVMRLSGGTHATGAGGVVVLEAAAGLGKTALLEHCARLAADAGCTVRHAAPGPHERQFPFGVIRTLLESPLREASERERASLLSGPAASAGALLLAGADASNLAHAVTSIAHDVTWLCAGLAQVRPLVLIVDDAHWCDRSSLQVLSYLAGRIEDLPLLILVAARIGDPRAANDLLTLLGGARSATVLRPQPLTSMGATRLIRGLAPETSIHVCADCHRTTAGNPWLLGELARQIQAHGPSAIEGPERAAPKVTAAARAVVRRRVAELEPRDRAVASARAVIGDGAPPHAVAQVAAVPLAELGPAHDALAGAGILGPDGDRIAHELIATAIRDDLAPAERERLHRESARALIELGATSEAVRDAEAPAREAHRGLHAQLGLGRVRGGV